MLLARNAKEVTWAHINCGAPYRQIPHWGFVLIMNAGFNLAKKKNQTTLRNIYYSEVLQDMQYAQEPHSEVMVHWG